MAKVIHSMIRVRDLDASMKFYEAAFGLKSADATAYVAAATVVFVVALGASWIPARRVMRTDPLVALRDD